MCPIVSGTGSPGLSWIKAGVHNIRPAGAVSVTHLTCYSTFKNWPVDVSGTHF